jgi:hypothetical protein
MPSNLALLSGEFLKMTLKDSSVSSSQSLIDKFKISQSDDKGI